MSINDMWVNEPNIMDVSYIAFPNLHSAYSVPNNIVRTIYIYSAGNNEERDEVEINHLQNVATQHRFVEGAQIGQLEQFTHMNFYGVLFDVMLMCNIRINIFFVAICYELLVPT